MKRSQQALAVAEEALDRRRRRRVGALDAHGRLDVRRGRVPRARVEAVVHKVEEPALVLGVDGEGLFGAREEKGPLDDAVERLLPAARERDGPERVQDADDVAVLGARAHGGLERPQQAGDGGLARAARLGRVRQT